MRFFIILGVLMVSFWKLSAQKRIEVQTDYSKILLHTSNIYFEAPPHTYTFGLSLDMPTRRDNLSFVARGNPYFGFQFYYMDYVDPKIGKAYGLMPRISFLKKWNQRWSTESRVALGVGYATKYYNRNPWSDTTYNIIGGHWNNMTLLSQKFQYNFNQQSALALNIGLAHVSSSNTTAPNYGINNVFAGISYVYNFKDTAQLGKTLLEVSPPRHRNTISIGYGYNSDKYIIGARFPVYMFQYAHQWINKEKLALWYLGVEAEMLTKIKSLDEYWDQTQDKFSFQDNFSLYLSIGREWFIGDFGLRLGGCLGYSFFTSTPTHLLKPSLYYYPFNKDYSSQNLFKNMYLGLGLTTKLFNAQYLEWTLGTTF